MIYNKEMSLRNIEGSFFVLKDILISLKLKIWYNIFEKATSLLKKEFKYEENIIIIFIYGNIMF